MSRPETDLRIDHDVIDVQNSEHCSSEKPEATFSCDALALAADTPIPRDVEGPVFTEPWQAQAFALVVALQNRGVFTADEWAQALGAEIREALAAGGCRDGSDYYERWCEALEHLLIEKGLASHAGVDALAASWARAAEATPHGKPILLENDPLRS